MFESLWTTIIRTQGKRNETLVRAIESVKGQTYKNKDIIISFHNSDISEFQGVQKIVNNEKDIYINLVKADFTKKRGNAINVALDNCESRYVSILDDDDLYLPEMGKVLIGDLLKYNANLAYGNTIIVRHEKDVSDDKILQKEKGYGEIFNPVRLVAQNYIHLSSCIYDFKQFSDVRVSEEIFTWEDWYLLLEMLFSSKLKAVYTDVNVSEYHVVGDDTSNTFHKMEKSIVKENICQIEEDFKDKDFCINYEDVFKIYPKLSIAYDNPNNSDVQKLLNIIKEYESLKDRKSFQLLKNLFRW